MIIVNDLCDFHDLYTSRSVPFVMYFNRRNKDIYYYYLLLLLQVNSTVPSTMAPLL